MMLSPSRWGFQVLSAWAAAFYMNGQALHLNGGVILNI